MSYKKYLKQFSVLKQQSYQNLAILNDNYFQVAKLYYQRWKLVVSRGQVDFGLGNSISKVGSPAGQFVFFKA